MKKDDVIFRGVTVFSVLGALVILYALVSAVVFLILYICGVKLF